VLVQLSLVHVKHLLVCQTAKLGTLRLGRMASASHGNIVAFSAGMANNTIGAIYSAGSEPTSAVSPNMLSIRPHVVFPTNVIGYTSPNMGGLVIERSIRSKQGYTLYQQLIQMLRAHSQTSLLSLTAAS
jgi:hypothetical protein